MTEHPNIASALVAALAGMSVVEKGRTANAGSYKYEYASIEDVVKKTRPVLAEHGVVALTPLHAHGDELACTVTFLHTSGERLDFGPFPFPHGKDAQATGSMVTYHRRYALVSALGMAAGDDDDDGAAAQPRQKPENIDRPISADNAEKITVACERDGLNVAQVIDKATKGRTDDPALVLISEVQAVRDAMAELKVA